MVIARRPIDPLTIGTPYREDRPNLSGDVKRSQAMFGITLSSLTFVSALGCGLIGGVFFAFSTFVMRGLNQLPAPQGIAAMQSINITVINAWFMVPFFGTAVACIALIVAGLRRWGEPGALLLLLGGALYLVGMVVTIACNVPRNDALAVVDPNSIEGAAQWERYVPEWTVWNTVRMAASLGAAAALIAAFIAARGEAPVAMLSGLGDVAGGER